MIGVIEYGMGNILSVCNAIEHLGFPSRVINNSGGLRDVDKIILPGVGAFGKGMDLLREMGFIETLNEEVIKKNKPFLGICLGMQLICKESFEFGRRDGLGWLPASVRRLDPALGIRVPHIGWDDINIKKPCCLVKDLYGAGNPDVYFVHSFYVDSADGDFVAATCEYGVEFAALIEKGNICAAQFHPEKSQKAGLSIIKNFAEADF